VCLIFFNYLQILQSVPICFLSYHQPVKLRYFKYPIQLKINFFYKFCQERPLSQVTSVKCQVQKAPPPGPLPQEGGGLTRDAEIVTRYALREEITGEVVRWRTGEVVNW
jgi:hypothetical protein